MFKRFVSYTASALFGIVCSIQTSSAAIINVDFVAEDFTSNQHTTAPVATVAGSLTWESDGMTSDIQQLRGVDITIDGFTYQLTDLVFNNHYSTEYYIGGAPSGAGGIPLGDFDDFAFKWSKSTGLITVFTYTTANDYGTWNSHNVTTDISITQNTVNSPGALALMLLGLGILLRITRHPHAKFSPAQA